MVVVLTNKAKLSIRNTAKYIEANFGKNSAISFGEEIAKVLVLLADIRVWVIWNNYWPMSRNNIGVL